MRKNIVLVTNQSIVLNIHYTDIGQNDYQVTNTYILSIVTIANVLSVLSGWPSGLRRQTQGYDPCSTPSLWSAGVLVHECGRGFESHF